MKRILALFLAVALLLSCAACGNGSKDTAPDMEPNISQMKAICELAVMECYYHNVAKYFEENADNGFFGIGKKDKHFWIEYSGVVKLGIDVSLVNVTIDDTLVTITIPEAKVLGCEVDSDSLYEGSFIVDQKSADVTAEDEILAFSEAQKHLEEAATADKALLANAQQRAQTLLEDYILNIGNAVGKEHTIKWVYLDTENNQVDPAVDEETD